MATRNALMTKDSDGSVTVSWSGLLNSSTDVGAAIAPGAIEGMTFQLSGTLGTGGAVTIQGSNDGVNWGALTNPAGSAAVLDAVGECVLIEARPRYVRPAVTAGDGATDLAVFMAGTRRSI